MKRVLSILLTCMILLNMTFVFSDSTNSTGAGAPVKAVDISSFADNTYIIDNNGQVWGWGDNNSRQLGEAVIAEQKSSFTPIRMLDMAGIKSISAGRGFLLALTNDGYVWGIGNNVSSQADTTSTKVSISKPTRFENLSSIEAISSGDGYALALKGDGSVWIWGDYRYKKSNKMNPVGVKGLSKIKKIYALNHYAFAVDSSGTVYELKGAYENATALDFISNIVDVVECDKRVFAAKDDGTLWTWSINGSDIKQVEGMSNIVQLSRNKTAGLLARDKDGALWQCDELTLKTDKVAGIDHIKKITSGYEHLAAIKTDGTVWTWGDNSKGQLGNGGSYCYNRPIRLDSITDVKSVAATKEYSVVLKNDGTVWTFGRNSEGQLGDGTRIDHYGPMLVKNLNDVEKISASATHVLALKKDGTVWSWGDNSCGQLGDGTFDDRLIPVQVKGISTAKDISAGNQFSVALVKNNTAWVWGNSGYGKPNGNNIIDRSKPIQVEGVYGIKMISAGFEHTLALTVDRYVWVWGGSGSGQYGYNVSAEDLDKAKAVKVSGVSGVDYISSGFDYCLAVKHNGLVLGWGNNSNGQLGVKNTDNIYSKYTIKDFADIVSVAAGKNHSFAIKKDGTLWAWGNNSSGQLGIGSDVAYFAPVQVTDLTDLKCVSAGDNYSMAVQNDGTLWTWGDNTFGQLGFGRRDSIVTDVPAQISLP